VAQVNNKVDVQTRLNFRDWLRDELRRLDFYQRRGDHYLIREFAKYCVEQGAPIDEASLGRYLRDDDPVLPTPERCRSLARVFEYEPIRVLIQAGYLEGNDLFPLLPKNPEPSQVSKAVELRKAVAQKLKADAQELGEEDGRSLNILADQVDQSILHSGQRTAVPTTKRPGKRVQVPAQ
jgi:hypothetical protein